MIRVESNEKETRETTDKPNKTKLVLGKYRQNLKKNSQSEQETEKNQPETGSASTEIKTVLDGITGRSAEAEDRTKDLEEKLAGNNQSSKKDKGSPRNEVSLRRP